MKTVDLILYSPGLGYINRGLETFTRELYEAVHEAPELAVTLFQGQGDDIVDGSRVVRAPRRNASVYNLLPYEVPLGRRYLIENLAFSLPLIKAAYQQERPIIHFSESVPARLLYKLRQQFGGDFTLLFSNGGPVAPEHYMRFDYVQVLTPMQRRQALEAGYPKERLFLVPYGLDTSIFDAERVAPSPELREQFDLPKDRTILLSVGAINTHHKRMDWLVEEVARLDESEYFLWMVGQKEGPETRVVEQLAEEKLCADGFRFDTFSYDRMPAVYRAADLFVLSSLHEGFGRVYIEAMASQRPVLAHPTGNTNWILGEDNPGLVEMDQPSALADRIKVFANDPSLQRDTSQVNQQRARQMFDWQVLKEDYMSMYRSIQENKI
ncbi:hypothetical protein CRI94_13990 [Longibacter salinarum]|uniref:Glycosyl transferase family 1 domain-containing protein n=1 Tax=Longibacter salinarum TaxID=1850348 RepID=A0A2A8CVA5_9BACT|nr:glycosyltransferase family 4 protein [Longibacter salinarum]PEN12622.1 hypothetical protein CRI94_13990 [Longibacter salinarum]